ncbi:LysR family transcriptional regulator [Mycoplasma sp. P36-A1]|uniref:LysR family transcriptional regulator n=1 Tax=Mycoplasma sp. P36-A1 TaxID=3252900 RepID=UPI003C2C09A9
MDIKHLDYFREIVDSNFNLSKAAGKLHITQPSLSMLVGSWEKQYGIKLFNKNKGRYTSLTKEGEYIYNHSIQLLKMHNEFLYSLEEIKRGFIGSIKVGIPPFISSILCRSAIVDFMNDYPDINLTLVEEGSIDLKKRLHNGDLDMAILNGPVDLENIKTTTLFNSELVVVLNKSLVTRADNYVALDELEHLNLVTFSEDFALYDSIAQQFKAKLLHPNITFKSSQLELILDIVNRSRSYTIVPESVIAQKSLDNVTVKKLSNSNSDWDVVLASNSNKLKTPALKFFEEYIINHFLAYDVVIKDVNKPINRW